MSSRSIFSLSSTSTSVSSALFILLGDIKSSILLSSISDISKVCFSKPVRVIASSRFSIPILIFAWALFPSAPKTTISFVILSPTCNSTMSPCESFAKNCPFSVFTVAITTFIIFSSYRLKFLIILDYRLKKKLMVLSLGTGS